MQIVGIFAVLVPLAIFKVYSKLMQIIKALPLDFGCALDLPKRV